MTISFAGETEETIMEALDALDTIESPSDRHAAKVQAKRDELLIELSKVRTQGTLF